ncbi:MAG: hypothetical protein JO069_11605 [Verrucomicrobia bacterium]|nr:hypothetical protein [Verrucomicrobiota bacterium]
MTRAARAFAAMLPLTMEMADLNGSEKYVLVAPFRLERLPIPIAARVLRAV